MTRGVVLFAHNNGKDDYYGMAVATAKRINFFLDLPVTVITDTNSIKQIKYTFDQTIIIEPDTTNQRKKASWYNKGRYKIYELTPYSDTIILDTDYLVNSTTLLDAYKLDTDFVCHDKIKWLMGGSDQEYFYRNFISTLWATVIRFKKTSRAKQIFDMMGAVQENYDHYTNIYRFSGGTFRNDYALTIALKTVNGHYSNPGDYFPWKLLHVPLDIKVYRDTLTSYTFVSVDKKNEKTYYLKVKDTDFHMLNKSNFMELVA